MWIFTQNILLNHEIEVEVPQAKNNMKSIYLFFPMMYLDTDSSEKQPIEPSNRSEPTVNCHDRSILKCPNTAPISPSQVSLDPENSATFIHVIDKIKNHVELFNTHWNPYYRTLFCSEGFYKLDSAFCLHFIFAVLLEQGCPICQSGPTGQSHQ